MSYFKVKPFVMIFCFFFLALTQVFGEITEKEIKELEEALNYGVPDERKRVLKKVEELKDIKLHFLIKKTIEDDKDPEILEMAVRMAGEFNVKGLEENILSLLTDSEDVKVKAASLRALGKMKYKKVSAKAQEELSNENKNIQIAAVFALGELEEKSSLEKLYGILDKVDDKEELLQEAIASIGKIKDKKSVEKLKEILENPGYSKYVRMYIPIALAKIGGKEVLDLLEKAASDKEYFIRIRAIHALSEVKGADLSALRKTVISSLKDSDPNIRLTALDVVKNSKDKEYVSYLKYMMEKDPDFKVRKKSVEVFAVVEDSAGVFKLFSEKMNKGDFFTKKFAIEAMKDMDTAEAVNMLEKAFYEQDNFDLRKAILGFLTDKIEKESALILLKKIALSKDLKGYYDSVNKLRGMALQGLSKAGWAKSIDVFRAVAEDEKDPIQVNAMQMITFLDKDNAKVYFLGLLAKSRNYGNNVRYQVVKSLMQIHPDGIEEELKIAFFNEQDLLIRNMLGKALKSYGIDNDVLERQFQERKVGQGQELKKAQEKQQQEKDDSFWNNKEKPKGQGK